MFADLVCLESNQSGKFPLGKALDKYSVQKKQVEHFYVKSTIFFSRSLKLAVFSQPQLSLPKGSFNLRFLSNLK